MISQLLMYMLAVAGAAVSAYAIVKYEQRQMKRIAEAWANESSKRIIRLVQQFPLKSTTMNHYAKYAIPEWKPEDCYMTGAIVMQKVDGAPKTYLLLHAYAAGAHGSACSISAARSGLNAPNESVEDYMKLDGVPRDYALWIPVTLNIIDPPVYAQ